MVEQLAVNQRVVGSNPTPGAIFSPIFLGNSLIKHIKTYKNIVLKNMLGEIKKDKNNVSFNEKKFLKRAAIIGGATGAVSGFLVSWLKDEFGLDLLTRLLIVAVVGVISMEFYIFFLKKKQCYGETN